MNRPYEHRKELARRWMKKFRTDLTGDVGGWIYKRIDNVTGQPTYRPVCQGYSSLYFRNRDVIEACVEAGEIRLPPRMSQEQRA